MGVIDVRGLRKMFGATVAVDDADFFVEPAEFFTILGPSGCGKTTTLRLVAGFERPDAGTIQIDGVDVSSVRPAGRPVNTVFQHYALFPHLSVFDNVAYGLRARRVGRADVARRVAEALAVVRLESLGRRRPRELSGGQQQRVALARALVCRPRALLLDEPLGALDVQLRAAMQAELKAIQREAGVAFLYVTHDQHEALSMSDRLAVMRDGRIEQIGSPREVYRAPASRFVAEFLGTASVLAGRAEPLQHGTRVVLDAGGWTDVGQPHPPGRVGVLVRPEDVVLDGTPATDGATDAVVVRSTFEGPTTRVVAETRGKESIVAFVPSGADTPFAAGSPVSVRIRTGAARILDEDAGASTSAGQAVERTG